MVQNALTRVRLCTEKRAMFPSSGARQGLEKPCWRAEKPWAGEHLPLVHLREGLKAAGPLQTACPHLLPCRGARAGGDAASLPADRKSVV